MHKRTTRGRPERPGNSEQAKLNKGKAPGKIKKILRDSAPNQGRKGAKRR